MFMVPSRSDAKAIFLPSGDQAGYEFSDLLLVRFLAAWPLALTTKISALPVRLVTTRSVGLSAWRAGAVCSARGVQPITSAIRKRAMLDTSPGWSNRTRAG